ncbi:MAG: DoxX family protein [Alphaproteobacteria bacterium]|nr:DoxX family protein [Alphaproteobacteria bacterium]
MNVALWIVQLLLAFAFLGAGGFKLVTPIEELLANGMAFVEHVPALLVRFIGLSEVAGALGLVLPAATRIQPKLTPIAASLLVVVMVLAALTHVVMNDLAGIAPSIVLGALSAFVAWGRFTKAPIEPRSAG